MFCFFVRLLIFWKNKQTNKQTFKVQKWFESFNFEMDWYQSWECLEEIVLDSVDWRSSEHCMIDFSLFEVFSNDYSWQLSFELWSLDLSFPHNSEVHNIPGHIEEILNFNEVFEIWWRNRKREREREREKERKYFEVLEKITIASFQEIHFRIRKMRIILLIHCSIHVPKMSISNLQLTKYKRFRKIW
jgi:hypothetical protein